MATTPAPPFSFLMRHPAHLVACGFGSGLAPVAPGTAGTLFAWISYPLLRTIIPEDAAFAVFLLLAFVLGINCCQITGRNLGVIDHGSIVWDEVVPFWGVLLITPAGWHWQLAAFIGFRCFDILKPAPAGFFDREVKNGFGVMMDDVIAAAYTLLTLALVKALAEGLM